ncbi:hypothetical protein G6O67_006601 [Ophiocordyceps sinensis]|uniref:Uncharacterized protein n=1 Tax=Ophiocordyceps sinensis TaxID=72228 RepID=A0A8H4LVU9_9HYPO|nr:hypothetical protein G6O67_006601 [Ophiocordyceps sinensis]
MSALDGTSSAGFSVKKSDGVMSTCSISTGLDGNRISHRLCTWDGNSHDGPVLDPRVVRQAKDAPDDNVLVQDGVVSSRGIGHAADFSPALQRVAAAGVQLVVLELGNPHVMLGKERTPSLDAVGVRQQQLRRRRRDLVADGLAADGVSLGHVLDLEGAVVKGREIDAGRGRDGRLADLVVVSAGVRAGVHGDGQALLLHERVAMAVDGGIDADAEQVLVVLRQGARADDVAPGRRLAGVDVDDGHDARCPGLDGDAGRLVELEGEDVLVVGERDDELQDELAAARHDSSSGAPVVVLPVDAVVLLVQADDLAGHLGRAIGLGQDAVKVLGRVSAPKSLCDAIRGFTLMTPRQSHPSVRLLTLLPSAPSPKSKACLR